MSNELHSGLAKQQGAVLIVSLVMLTILTVIAVGTTTDVGLQANMAKNSQLSIRAFNASLSQLNTRFNTLTINNIYEDVLGEIYRNQDPVIENTPATANNPFDLTFTMASITPDGSKSLGGSNVHGVTIGGSGGGGSQQASLWFEFHSVSDLPNSGLGSNQTYGVYYVTSK